MNIEQLQKLAALIRYYILVSTTEVGSGHPTSSLSATDLLTTLFFDGPVLSEEMHQTVRPEAEGFFHFDLDNPDYIGNDRLIFSKGHASPLFYALYLAAGVVSPEEIMTIRKFDSRLEGHPTPRFPYTEAATGSLGQGLSVGVGMALALRAQNQISNINPPVGGQKHKSKIKNINNSIPRVFVLLGDGEMAEGSAWEAINIASHYRLDNLVAIVDVNRLGQSQETMLGWDTDTYKKRFEAFGWNTVVIDGHDYKQIADAFAQITNNKEQKTKKPYAIIAKTIKGKGVSFLENKDGWHGKVVPPDQLEKALSELKPVDLHLRGTVAKPAGREISNFHPPTGGSNKIQNSKSKIEKSKYKPGDQIATRKAYGTALARLGSLYPQVVVLDAEVKNSTYAEIFKEKFPDRFFEMFIAEQNMVSSAVGFARLGYVPFVSSFACFLTRGFDQMRMAALSGANVKFCGSHAGVSIGEDGPSQMGLEDLSMFRSLFGSVVLYPADAVAAEKLVEEMIRHTGICYMRTSRPPTPVIYDNGEEFPIGGCKIHYSKITNDKLQITNKSQNPKSKIILIAAGVTLFEALKAQQELAKEGIEAVVVDCYSIKPIDEKGLRTLVSTLKQRSNTPIQIVTVEDHWYEGGLGDAVLNVFSTDRSVAIHKLAVTKLPRSGKPAELLDYEGISAKGIINKVKEIV